MSQKFNLRTLEIKSFRGIKNYTINFDSKSLVLVGENGSGKSSIVNAFEYLFTGKVESLSGKQAIKHNDSLVHLGDKKEDLFVEAKIGKNVITRTLKDGVSYKDSDILEDFKHGSFLLNRQKLLKFIESTPTKRYESITSLIGFEYLDNIESILNKTQKSFKNKVKSKNTELDDKIKTIEKVYDCNISEIYDKINEILIRNDLTPIDSDSDLKDFIKNFSKQDFEKINELNELLKLMDIDIIHLNDEYQNLLNDYEEATLNELKSASNLLEILNKTDTYILNENPDKCPICQNNINPTEITDYIQLKKEELSENTNTLQNWRNNYKEFSEKLKNLNYKLTSIKNRIDDNEFELHLDELIFDLDNLANFKLKVSEIDKKALINLNNNFLSIKDNIKREYEKLNDAENIAELNNVYEVIFNLNEKKNIENELEILEKQFNLAEKTYSSFKNKKQEEVDRIIKDIQELVTKYYNFIHKDESFNSPHINAPKSTRITIDLTFNNITADPRSYSSEGHLDSLGLCIFLAFAKMFNKYDFLILDDIISTVDLSHKERIIKLLFNEFRDYKFIITTHNKLWFRQVKNFAQKYKINGSFIFAEIRTLDEQTGPVLSINMFSKEVIENHLQNGDTFAAGNSIRRYLESVFEKICKENQIPVPLKDHLMVNDYYEAITSFFEEMFDESSPEIIEYYTEVFENLDNGRYLGNLLSHNDEDNYDITIREVEEFRDAVFEFEKSMQCDAKHNNYLRFDKKNKIARCSRKNCPGMMKLTKD
ncbi:DUF2813 domain-containing protein [uncultured Methanobrevibacter sp.]|uniref:DUF2813 domain-containing protein n=1 Tax=uncultured Methanobrevibacter sp. TaxID=253161 RepID=UPI0025F34F39|nr:DUF2813 domain-containing protein [uncultured Methanobrevibacter sp.]